MVPARSHAWLGALGSRGVDVSSLPEPWAASAWGWTGWLLPVPVPVAVCCDCSKTLCPQPRLPRRESSLSLHQYFQYDTLQQKLKVLEEENQKLRLEVSGLCLWGGVGAPCQNLATYCKKSSVPWGGASALELTIPLALQAALVFLFCFFYPLELCRSVCLGPLRLDRSRGLDSVLHDYPPLAQPMLTVCSAQSLCLPFSPRPPTLLQKPVIMRTRSSS